MWARQIKELKLSFSGHMVREEENGTKLINFGLQEIEKKSATDLL